MPELDDAQFTFYRIESKATVVFKLDGTRIQEHCPVAKTGENILSNEHAHRDVMADLQVHPELSYFVTSSKDKTTRVYFTRELMFC